MIFYSKIEKQTGNWKKLKLERLIIESNAEAQRLDTGSWGITNTKLIIYKVCLGVVSSFRDRHIVKP